MTIDRGLRRIFGGLGTTYIERVDVIGNPAFLKFVEQLERDEDITLETFDPKEPLVITTIEVDASKLDRDITIPTISPILARKKTLAEEIEALDVRQIECPKLPKKEGDAASQQFHYAGRDTITCSCGLIREYDVAA